MLPYDFTKTNKHLKTRVQTDVYKLIHYDKIWNDVRQP